MEVVIVAGGLGTRMKESFPGTPKALLPIVDTPLLDLNMAWMIERGLKEFVICTGHLAVEIQEHVRERFPSDIRVRVSRETVPRGTAGAIRDIEPAPTDDFVVLYGDVLALMDVAGLVETHRTSGAMATLTVHPNDHPHDSDLVAVDDVGRVNAVYPKGRQRAHRGNLANAGVFVLSPEIIRFIDPERPEDLFGDVLVRLVDNGLHVHSFRNYGYVKDVGTPERLASVADALRKGEVARRALGGPGSAAFLDRDGVLVEAIPDITNRDEMKVLPGVPAALRRLNAAGIKTVVVTNQPVVARGGITEPALRDLHRDLEYELGLGGAYLDAISYCPHHPDAGFADEVESLKRPCACRKPGVELGRRAAADMGIDLAGSFMVGDSHRDRGFARRLGIPAVTVRSGESLGAVPAPDPEDVVVSDLTEAVAFMLDSVPSVSSFADTVRAGTTVLVGGRSRAGKTAFAAALSIAIRRRGDDVVHLSLDRWIVPTQQRLAGFNVFDRYEWDVASAAVGRLVTKRGVHLVPRRNVLREFLGLSPVLVGDGTVVILDGPIALSLREEIDALTVFVDADPDVLMDRFRDFYMWKGLGATEIEALADQRREETAAVEETRAVADVVVNWDGYCLVSV